MRKLLMLSASVFALSLGGCSSFDFLGFDEYVQNCPPGSVQGHCEDSDAAIQVEHPETPPRPDPTDDDDDQDDDDGDDDSGCKDDEGPY